MAPEQALRMMLPVVLGIAGALTLDFMCAVRGFLPPGFQAPWRRVLAGVVVAGLLALGVFAPLGSFGPSLAEPDFSNVSTPQLFALHFLMMATLGTWFLLGYAGRGAQPRPRPLSAPALEPALEPVPPETPPPAPPPPVRLSQQFAAQFGYRTPDFLREVGLGLALGLAAWVVVLLAVIVVAGVLFALGGEDMVPQQPPALIPFIAGLPVITRMLISLSAGVVEESFFRGFLQPRVGIPLSTALFALAHLSYGQPFLLIGITLLSLIYAFLVQWRQNLWPAIAAHTLFDGVQLLIVVPGALRLLQGTGGKAAAWLAGLP